VIVEGGRWISRATRCVSPFEGGVSCSTRCVSPMRAVSRTGNGFQSGVSMVCWQDRCGLPVFDGLRGGERTHSHHQDGGGVEPPRAGIGSGVGMRQYDVV